MYREADPVSETSARPLARAVAVACGATLLAAGLLTTPFPAAAQETGSGGLQPELAVSAGTLAGSDFGNVGLGGGGELGLRYGVTSRLSLGLLGQASWHGADGLDGPLRLLGAALEPRYAFTDAGGARWTPFVEARLGVSRWNVTESADTLSADVSADGLQAGGSVGVAWALSESADLEVAATASYLSFGDARVDARLGQEESSFTRANSGTTGSLLGVRTGLRIRLP